MTVSPSVVDTIGLRVRRARRARGMTLQVLADRSGLSKSFLSMVENGGRSLERRRHIAAVAEALGISPADVIGSAAELGGMARTRGGHEFVHEVRVTLLTEGLERAEGYLLLPAELLLVEAEEIN
ncbi:MAG: helix-turn-helix domain-containing protein, partial [Angustibacter sp.]